MFSRVVRKNNTCNIFFFCFYLHKTNNEGQTSIDCQIKEKYNMSIVMWFQLQSALVEKQINDLNHLVY